MNKIKAVVVDDDERSRNVIRMMIGEHLPEIEIVAVASNVDEAYREITRTEPDLVYLDIQLEKDDCFSLLNRFEEASFEVIFITAYDEYALKAIRFSALDFILKPVDPAELIKATSKYISKKRHRNSNQRLENLVENMGGKAPSRIALPSQTDIQFIEVDSIIRIEAEKNYSVFYTTGRKPIIVSKTLKEYEDMLSGLPFFRVHQSHLINLNKVDRYLKGRGGYVVMNDGTTLEVSARKKDNFLAALRDGYI